MSTRLWLKKSADQSIEKTPESDFTYGILNGVDVRKENGNLYIDEHYLDPATAVSQESISIDLKFIKSATFKGKIKDLDSFCSVGRYQHRGGTAVVDFEESFHGNSMSLEGRNEFLKERFQTIFISAGSFRTLCEIYEKIRSRELQPAKPWGKQVKSPETEDSLRAELEIKGMLDD